MSSLFQNSNKNYLKILFNFKYYFDPVFGLGRSTGGRLCLLQARTVDRTIDRTFGNWGVHVVHIPGQPIGRPVSYCGRPGGRPTVTSLISVKHGRPTGRPRANGQIFCEWPVNWPVDR